MKLLTAVLMLVFATVSFASTETRTFFFDGSQDSVQMSLSAEETRTEYRYEQRQTICYRQQVFYRTTCHSTPQGNFCQSIPYYRTVSYPCIQTVRVPYEVKEFDVEAKVDLKILNAPEGAAETFKVTLDGAKLTLSAQGSKRYFIMLKDQNISRQVNGSVKLITATFEAELVEAAPVLSALSMTNISMKDSILSFTMGPVAAAEFIGYALTVKKAPILGSDTILFDRELSKNEIQISSTDRISSGRVSIEQLGVTLTSGRHTLTAKAFFKHPGSILNGQDFEATETSRTLIYKVR